MLNKTQALYKILYLNEFLLVVFCIQSKMCGNISEPRFCAWCGFVPRIFWWGNLFVGGIEMKRKAISWLLLLVVLFSCLPVNSVIAKTSKTKAEAFSYLNGLVGQTVGSGECVALISAYYKYLGFSPVSGNGCDYATNAIPSGSGWTREKGGVPRPGDILVYTGGYGHVAICESTNVAWHQNWNGRYVQKVTRNYSAGYTYGGQYVSYWGCIHVAFADETPTEQPVNLGDSFYGIILHRDAWKPIEVCDDGFVRLGNENGYANQVWKFTRESDGCYTIASALNKKLLEAYAGVTSNGNPTAAASEDWGGNYQRWYIYKYDNGYIIKSRHYKDLDRVLDIPSNNAVVGATVTTYQRNNTRAQIFAIYKSDDVQLKSPTLSASVNQSNSKVTFDWSEVYGEGRYDVKIWKNKVYQGDAYHIEWGAGHNYSIQLPPGYYEAYVDASNAFECKMSNVVGFTVPTQSTPFNLTCTDNISTVINNTSSPQTVTIAIAEYSNGTLSDVHTQTETFAPNETKTYSHSANARVFVWDSLTGMKPLAK